MCPLYPLCRSRSSSHWPLSLTPLILSYLVSLVGPLCLLLSCLFSPLFSRSYPALHDVAELSLSGLHAVRSFVLLTVALSCCCLLYEQFPSPCSLLLASCLPLAHACSCLRFPTRCLLFLVSKRNQADLSREEQNTVLCSCMFLSVVVSCEGRSFAGAQRG